MSSMLKKYSHDKAATSESQYFEPQFPVKIPKSFLSQINFGNPNDPLLLQVLPDADESKPIDGFAADPVGDLRAVLGEGLIKKYQGRVLVLVNGACAIHCRFCFRQNFPYDSVGSHLRQIDALNKFCSEDATIDEVILSGGDPLTAPDEVLGAWIHALNAIPQVKTVRIHSRIPVVMPSRVTDEFLSRFDDLKAQKIMVLHVNHAQELSVDAEGALFQLRKAGFVCLSQSVLLRGINDSLEVLEQLFKSLCQLGVIPYYLHQLDRVKGAQRFWVEEAVGVDLIHQLRTRLPGYAVPRYVRETAGELSKTVIV